MRRTRSAVGAIIFCGVVTASGCVASRRAMYERHLTAVVPREPARPARALAGRAPQHEASLGALPAPTTAIPGDASGLP